MKKIKILLMWCFMEEQEWEKQRFLKNWQREDILSWIWKKWQIIKVLFWGTV